MKNTIKNIDNLNSDPLMGWQLDVIKDASISNNEAAAKIGRSYASVKYHRKKNNVKVIPSAKQIDYWTDDEVEVILKNKDKTNAEIAKALNRTVQAVSIKRQRLGVPGTTPLWSKEEVKYLTDNYHIFSAAEIARQLNRTTASIVSYAHSLGLSKKNTFWSKQEIKILQENIKLIPTKLIELLPNKTLNQISYKKSHLNFFNAQKTNEKDSDIDTDIRLSVASIKIRYIELLNTLEVGQSFEYPAGDKERINSASRELAHKRYVTRIIDEKTRRVWRID
jgi:hypothetical protein